MRDHWKHYNEAENLLKKITDGDVPHTEADATLTAIIALTHAVLAIADRPWS
jgi:hypothetical protein